MYAPNANLGILLTKKPTHVRFVPDLVQLVSLETCQNVLLVSNHILNSLPPMVHASLVQSLIA